MKPCHLPAIILVSTNVKANLICKRRAVRPLVLIKRFPRVMGVRLQAYKVRGALSKGGAENVLFYYPLYIQPGGLTGKGVYMDIL